MPGVKVSGGGFDLVGVSDQGTGQCKEDEAKVMGDGVCIG